MAILPIVKYPDPVLRKKAEPVRKITKSIKKLIQDMFDTLKKTGGVGLAAPQVGVSKRIIVIDLSSRERGRATPMTLINPEILYHEGEEEDEEGCLSFPPEARGVVPRAVKITVRGINAEGKEERLQAVDMLSRVLQHEIDHLNGVMFIDRMGIAQMMKIRAILDGAGEDNRKRSAA